MQEKGLSSGSAHKESTCNAGDLGFIPGLGRSLGRERLPTPVFWPGECHGLYGWWGHKESDMTEWPLLHIQGKGRKAALSISITWVRGRNTFSESFSKFSSYWPHFYRMAFPNCEEAFLAFLRKWSKKEKVFINQECGPHISKMIRYVFKWLSYMIEQEECMPYDTYDTFKHDTMDALRMKRL